MIVAYHAQVKRTQPFAYTTLCIPKKTKYDCTRCTFLKPKHQEPCAKLDESQRSKEAECSVKRQVFNYIMSTTVDEVTN